MDCKPELVSPRQRHNKNPEGLKSASAGRSRHKSIRVGFDLLGIAAIVFMVWRGQESPHVGVVRLTSKLGGQVIFDMVVSPQTTIQFPVFHTNALGVTQSVVTTNWASYRKFFRK